MYTTSESEGILELTVFVFSHPVDGTPRPFNLFVSTSVGTAGTCMYVLCTLHTYDTRATLKSGLFM